MIIAFFVPNEQLPVIIPRSAISTDRKTSAGGRLQLSKNYEDPMRRASLQPFLLMATVIFFAATLPASAQWSTPTVDGSIGSGEYGANNSLQNAGNTGQTWYMTWDSTNLYVGIVNANLSEAAVIYLAPNPQNPPICCGASDGSLTGFNYDGTDFSSLPFRAKFVTYVKDGYREYRTSNGGGWSGPTAN